MGGYVAIDIAINATEKLKKLILINTTPYPVNQNTLQDRNKAIQYAEKGDMASILTMSKGICYYQPKEEWLLSEEKMAYEIGCPAYINQQRAVMNRKNYSSLLKSIQCETLIVGGKEDKITPYQDSIYMFENIKNSDLLLLNKCGHLSTLEKGNEVAQNIINFLSK